MKRKKKSEGEEDEELKEKKKKLKKDIYIYIHTHTHTYTFGVQKALGSEVATVTSKNIVILFIFLFKQNIHLTPKIFLRHETTLRTYFYSK